MFPKAYDFTILDRPVLIEEQLIEVTDQKFGQRHILTLASYMNNKEEIMLKIRHEYVQHICSVPISI